MSSLETESPLEVCFNYRCPFCNENAPTQRITSSWSGAARKYGAAFTSTSLKEDFITYYKVIETGKKGTKPLKTTTLTREQFLSLSTYAYKILQNKYGVKKGDFVCHYFSGNQIEDLVFRFAEIMLGVSTVTVNWSADTVERIEYKIRLVEKCNTIIVDSETDKEKLDVLKARLPNLRVHSVGTESCFDSQCPIKQHSESFDLKVEEFDKLHSRMIIYTSGTTGNPKGVKLSYRSYESNAQTFEDFLELSSGNEAIYFEPVVVNPLHHANSTSISDMALRRPKTHLRLFQRYTTAYWKILADLGHHCQKSSRSVRIVAPSVSRHFDFLENLDVVESFGRTPESMKTGLGEIDFLIGSAPVGPKTIQKLKKFTGRLPLVRFGSTETCLQVMGTLRKRTEADRLLAFKKGWSHTFKSQPNPGYYIGEQHEGFTQVEVVKAVDQSSPDYMHPCLEGEPGFIVTRGFNVMSGYVQNEEATRTALVKHDITHSPAEPSLPMNRLPWYVNLGDIGFWLQGKDHKDVYWMSRESELLIIGGANYSCAQINDDLKTFLIKQYPGLTQNDVVVGTVGMRINSEHEDECLVTVELSPSISQALQKRVREEFVSDALTAVKQRKLSKGAKPSRVRFGTVPKNFKGAILVKDMKRTWKEIIDQEDKS